MLIPLGFFCRKRFELRSHGFLMGSPEESCLFKLKSLLVIKSRPALQLNTQLPYFYSLYGNVQRCSKTVLNHQTVKESPPGVCSTQADI